MILNSIIALIFYNLGYFVITPKPYSFGGQYLTLIYGLKFSNQKKMQPYMFIFQSKYETMNVEWFSEYKQSKHSKLKIWHI